MTIRARAVRLVARPHGWPSGEEFSTVTIRLDEPEPGTALVENLYLSVDPYMREEMDPGGWALDAPLEGRAIGRVIASRVPELAVGALVLHRQGWTTHAVVRPANARPIDPPDGVPVSAYLGVLGGTGLSAYVGLTRVAKLRPGESVFISAAAGAVGGAAGQLARLLGASRVVGSTGSAAKVAHLTGTLGFDAAFDYHQGPIAARLAEAAPDGIDVYLDNVGGEHLEAAIQVLREYGRVAWCGAIGQYNSVEPPAAPRNLFDAVGKSLRIEGFLVFNNMDAREEYERFLVPHVRSGRVVVDQTVVDGFDHVVDAFLAMLRGGNTGKMLVRLAAG